MDNTFYFTTVNHEARLNLEISVFEYCIADCIYHLQANPKSSIPGWCYAKPEYFIDFLGLSRATYFRSVENLVKKGLLERHPDTQGLVKTTYKWYEQVVFKTEKSESQNETTVSKRDAKSLKMRLDESQNETDTIITINDKYIDNNTSNGQAVTGKEFNELVSFFSCVNPNYERLFANKSQRAALDRLVKKHGLEKMRWVVKKLPEISSKPYAPIVTTPCQLENKLGQLVLFLRQEKMKGGGTIDARNL
jgi:hypothetical protein